MARRVPEYGNGGGLVLVAAGLALYFAFPIIVAVVVYGTFIGITIGLIVSEYRAHDRPSITSETQLNTHEDFSDEESSALQSLKEQQDELSRQQAEIYWQGDQSGLIRRQSDGRFHARAEGRSLNAQLGKLDTHFVAIEDEMTTIKLNSAHRRQQQANEFTEWQAKHTLAIVFRATCGAYIVCAVGLAIYNPPLLQQLTQFLAQSTWLYMPVLAPLNGPLVLASALAIATFIFLFLEYTDEVFVQVSTSWIGEQRDQNIGYFMTANEPVEPEYSGNGGPWGRAQADSESGPWGNAQTDGDKKKEKPQSPHEILGVSANATRDEIIAAHRELIKQYHPDFQQNRGPKLQELAKRESQILNRAKEDALKQL